MKFLKNSVEISGLWLLIMVYGKLYIIFIVHYAL